MKKIIILSLVLITGILAGCGGAAEQTTGEPQRQAAVKDTPTATPTATPTPTVDPDACKTLGIVIGGKEGNCTDDTGTKVNVVNKDTKLHLKQVDVRVNSIETADYIPVEYDSPLVGSFVVANVTLTNNMPLPMTTDATSQFVLLLGKRNYEPDSDAMIEANSMDSKLIFDKLQPDESTTGKVIFRVAKKRIGALSTNGNLVVFQPSDVDNVQFGGDAKSRVGYVRTYQ
jgi:hypothetical protein